MIRQIYRKSSIKCLRNLWHRLQVYHQLGNSEPLPSYVLVAFNDPIMDYCLGSVQDVAASMMGRCIKALTINEPIADVDPSTNSRAQIRHRKQLMEWSRSWYSNILHAEEDDVKFFLDFPGATSLAAMVTIISGGIGSSDAEEVRDVAQQTLAILHQTANLQLEQPIAQLDNSDAKFDRIVLSGLRNLLQKCVLDGSTLTSDVRRGCLRISLKCLWCCAKAYQQLDAFGPSSAYFFSTLGVARPELIRLVQTEQDLNSWVIGRSISALVVMKLMADIRSRSNSRVQISNDELTCLSIILDTGSDDMKYCLEWPGAVELATIASLTLGVFGPFGDYPLEWEVRRVTEEALAIVSRSLPAENMVGLQPFEWDDIVNGKLARMVVSSLYNLLQVHISGASTLTAEVRRACLRMYLKSLWYCAKTYHQPGISRPFPSYFPNILASPEIIRLIHVEQDPSSHVIGRCFGALVVAKLAADIRSRTDSNVTIKDDKLTCLSAILGAKSSKVEVCLERQGVIELVSMVSIALGNVGPLGVDALPSGVRDVVQQTLTILSHKAKLKPDQPIARLNFLDGEFYGNIVSDFHDLLQECISGTSFASPEVRKSCLRMSLDCLWHCVWAYLQPGTSKSLPSYFPNTLASPEIIRLIHVEKDRISRLTGRCFGALVAMKLAVDIRSRADLNLQNSDEEIACLSAILSVESPDLKNWLCQPCAIELATILFLISSEIDLFSGKVPSEVLDMVQQTYSILTQTLPAELNDKLTNFTDGKCDIKCLSCLFRLKWLIRDLTPYWYRTNTREAVGHVSRELVALC